MAEELADKVWNICTRWDYFAKGKIGKQLVRAVDSISANLAEGHGRYHFRDRLRFCYYARGSLEETKAWLSKAERRSLMPEEQSPVKEITEILPKKLNAHIRSIRKAQENT